MSHKVQPIGEAIIVSDTRLKFCPENFYRTYLKLSKKCQYPVDYEFETNLPTFFTVTPNKSTIDFVLTEYVRICYKHPQKIEQIPFAPKFKLTWRYSQNPKTDFEVWGGAAGDEIDNQSSIILTTELVPMRSESDLPLYIPIKEVLKKLKCSICKFWLREVRFSPACGHRYCDICIQDYLLAVREREVEDEMDRSTAHDETNSINPVLIRKECPENGCSFVVDPNSLTLDRHFDEIVSSILKEKFEAEKKYAHLK